MGRYLIKPKKDVDFYVYWSSFIDDGVAWGDKEFLMAQDFHPPLDKSRFQRCDEKGTSAYWFSNVWEDGQGEVWRQEGFLPYSNMEDFFTAIENLYPDDIPIPENLLELHPELKSYLTELDSEEGN